jgi:cytochrome b561
LVHVGLALAIIIQLSSSLVMEPVEPGRAGNVFFTVHGYGGLVAFAFVLGFWLVVSFRRRGTELGLLLPWLSAVRRTALWSDLRKQLSSVAALKMPPHDPTSPLASAIHGLGLLLMTAMAASGTLYYFVNTGDPDAGGLVGLAMVVHQTLANLAWAYLIGHGAMALLHHMTQQADMSEMWSLRRG